MWVEWKLQEPVQDTVLFCFQKRTSVVTVKKSPDPTDPIKTTQ